MKILKEAYTVTKTVIINGVEMIGKVHYPAEIEYDDGELEAEADRMTILWRKYLETHCTGALAFVDGESHFLCDRHGVDCPKNTR